MTWAGDATRGCQVGQGGGATGAVNGTPDDIGHGTRDAVLLGSVRTVLLVIVLALRAVILPGAAAGLAYYPSPDMTRPADAEVCTSALAQASSR